MKLKLRHAITQDAEKHSYLVLELLRRAHNDSNWTEPYAELLRAIRSDSAETKKVKQYLSWLARYGTDAFMFNSQARWVGDKLLELKPRSQRLLLFQDNKRWIIADAFKKPPKKEQSARIESAGEIRSIYFTAKA